MTNVKFFCGKKRKDLHKTKNYYNFARIFE